MSQPTDREFIDRHRQSIGEAQAACQRLGRHADPEFIGLRGGDYALLRRSLNELEGSARQIGTIRSDARWIKFGIHYAQMMRVVQKFYCENKWGSFPKLVEVLNADLRNLAELEKKTGVIGPILPQHASSWLTLPDYTPVMPKRQIQLH